MSSSPETSSKQKFLGGHRSTAYAAFGFIIIVVLCAVVLIIKFTTDDKTPGTALPNALPTTSAAPLNETADPDQKSLTEAPETVWALFGALALPSAPGVGPSQLDGVIATGYQRSPTGALFAVANSSYRLVMAGDEDWEEATESMMAAGPGNDIWREIRGGYTGSPVDPTDPALTQIAGFKFLSYDQDRALIELVSKDSKGRYQSGTYQMVWEDGDWKLALTDEGKFTVTTGEIPNLAGFITWQGVS